jgi:hypothetical protein
MKNTEKHNDCDTNRIFASTSAIFKHAFESAWAKSKKYTDIPLWMRVRRCELQHDFIPVD